MVDILDQSMKTVGGIDLGFKFDIFLSHFLNTRKGQKPDFISEGLDWKIYRGNVLYPLQFTATLRTQ
jgi:hypothetical protein